MIKVSSFQLALISHSISSQSLKAVRNTVTNYPDKVLPDTILSKNRVFLILSPGVLTTRIEFEIFNSTPVLKTAVKSDE